LWLVLSLAIFFLNFYGFELVVEVFKGRVSIEDFFEFEIFYPICASVVGGWLMQCLIVIALSRGRTKAKQ
jgi:hypothetical protein